MKENEAGFQNFPIYTTRSTSRSRFLFVIVIVFILLAALLAGLFMLGSSQKKAVAPIPTPLVKASATPFPASVSAVLSGGLTATVSPTAGIAVVDKATNLDRSELAVAVLNGSGTAGAAKEVSDYLQSLGYKIVQVGNADVFTYTNLNVIVRKSKSRYADLLRKDLRANPEFASASASISDDISDDAQVIVGE